MSFNTDIDSRDLKEWKEEEMFAYTSPSTSPKTIYYIEKVAIELMKQVIPPEEGVSGRFHRAYFQHGGKFAGTASFCYFLQAPEIRDELMTDERFMALAHQHNVTWFMPDTVKDVFVF